MRALTVAYRTNGEIVVENPTEATLHGASFLVRDEPGRLAPELDGARLPNGSLRREDGNLIFWFDVESHARRVVTLVGITRPLVQTVQFRLEVAP
jgi:hypothetical protein